MKRINKDLLKKLEATVKQDLPEDSNLNNFLRPFFSLESDRRYFIKKCLVKMQTRRMLLRAQWYSEIADGLNKIKFNRPALQIIFLMALAEGVVLLGGDFEKKDIRNSNKMIRIFFKCATLADKDLLTRKFKRAYVKFKHHELRFSSVVNILYNIRNNAVHGKDFYSFSLLDENKKKEFVDDGFTSYGIITDGPLGKKKKRVPLDISLTYQELRDVIVRTAINNISKHF